MLLSRHALLCSLSISFVGAAIEHDDIKARTGLLVSELQPLGLDNIPHMQASDSDSDGEDFTFVTAANRESDKEFDHSCVLLLLLKSLNVTYPKSRVIVYDLGFNETLGLDSEVLQAAFPGRLELRNFDYSKFPSYVRVDQPSAGQYAWKPIIIKTVVDEFNTVLWLDAGNSVSWTKSGLEPNNITSVFKHLREVGFYSPSSKGSMRMWTHPGMLNSMHIDSSTEYLDQSPCNGAFIGFSKPSVAYDKILVPWYTCALDKACIGPEGSSRSNHRQDQAALSLLVYEQGLTCFPQCISSCGGVRLHNDHLRRSHVFCTAFRRRFKNGVAG